MQGSYPRLLGDVGGTNARLAWVEGPGQAPSRVDTLRGDDHASLEAAMRHYLDAHHLPAPRWAAIGIATTVLGDRVQMTNRDWSFSIEEMRGRLGLERFLVLNDFTALALALPALQPGDLRRVGGGEPVAGTPVALIGPGTGLGVSGLVPTPGGRLVPLSGEGGHVTLAGASPQEDAVIVRLRERFGHASAERAVSGPGLVNLYVALCEIEGVTPETLDAAAITQRSRPGADRRCALAVELFFAFLGSVAGNLALSLGARGGVYIGGGIVPRLGERIEQSAFRERFEAKGRFRDYLSAMPTFVVQARHSPALLGVARALDDLAAAGG